MHNFLRCNGNIDKAFRAEQESDEDVDIDLPNEKDKIAAEVDAGSKEDLPWVHLRDYMAHELR